MDGVDCGIGLTPVEIRGCIEALTENNCQDAD